MQQDIELLRETEIFRNLTEEQISKLLEISRKMTFSEGEVIMREGEEGDTLYIILEGTVEVAKSLVIGGEDDEGPEKIRSLPSWMPLYMPCSGRWRSLKR
jgi:hypothetical protein